MLTSSAFATTGDHRPAILSAAASLLAVFVLSLLAPAATLAADEVLIWPDFEPGTRFTLELTKTREQRKPGQAKPDKTGQSTTPIDVEVLECGPGGVVIAWTWGEPDLGDKQADFEPVAALLGDLMKLRLEIEIDEYERCQDEFLRTADGGPRRRLSASTC